MKTQLKKFLLALSFAAITFAAYNQEKPNIVFILADDLGWKDLGCMGQKQQVQFRDLPFERVTGN